MRRRVIDVRVRNAGESPVPYQSWQSDQNAKLFDGDRTVPVWNGDFAKVELHADSASTTLDAGRVNRDPVIFRVRAPLEQPHLRLTLPGQNIGGTGAFHFELPRD